MAKKFVYKIENESTMIFQRSESYKPVGLVNWEFLPVLQLGFRKGREVNLKTGHFARDKLKIGHLFCKSWGSVFSNSSFE